MEKKRLQVTTNLAILIKQHWLLMNIISDTSLQPGGMSVVEQNINIRFAKDKNINR